VVNLSKHTTIWYKLSALFSFYSCFGHCTHYNYYSYVQHDDFFQEILQYKSFISTLNGYQDTIKEMYMHWPIVKLSLRFIAATFSVLNKQLSVLYWTQWLSLCLFAVYALPILSEIQKHIHWMYFWLQSGLCIYMCILLWRWKSNTLLHPCNCFDLSCHYWVSNTSYLLQQCTEIL